MWAKAVVGAYHVSNSGLSGLWSVRRIASIQGDKYLVLESIQLPKEIARYCSKRKQGGVVMAKHVGAGGGGIFATLHDVVEHILSIEEPKPVVEAPSPAEKDGIDTLAERIANVVVDRMDQHIRAIVVNEIEKQFGKL